MTYKRHWHIAVRLSDGRDHIGPVFKTKKAAEARLVGAKPGALRLIACELGIWSGQCSKSRTTFLPDPVRE